MNKKHIGLLIVFTALSIVLGTVVITKNPTKTADTIDTKQDSSSPPSSSKKTTTKPEATPSHRLTVEGVYECLQPASQQGEQRTSCALGIKLDDGTYYALFDPTNTQVVGVASGKRIKVVGLHVPAVNSAYITNGTINVESLIKL